MSTKLIMFKEWSPQKSNPEIDRLDKETQRIKQQIHDLREFGRQKRLNRLQALDAFETRRVTLMEILRRMEKELEDEDVYRYGDILAEVFGERKIFAHRAIGLEALLCQFMHQMLAKQHQLKIIKKSAKDIQSKYKKFKLKTKDEFHSFEALAVQAEASRLTLEAVVDDIFASQHRMFALLLNQGETGEGTITNYSKPSGSTPKKLEKKPSLVVSTKHPVLREDYEGAQTPDTEGGNDSDDFEAAMDILSHREGEDDENIQPATGAHQHEDEKKEMVEVEIRKSSSSSSRRSSRTRSPKKNEDGGADASTAASKPHSSRPSSSSSSRRSSTSSLKSARERRREIEQLRQARVVGGAPTTRSASTPSVSTLNDVILNPNTDGGKDDDDDDAISPTSARHRMRELETKRQSLSISPITAVEGKEDSNAEFRKSKSEDPQPQQRSSRRSTLEGSQSSQNQQYKNGEEETEEERKLRERRERRKERASRKLSKQDLGFEI